MEGSCFSPRHGKKNGNFESFSPHMDRTSDPARTRHSYRCWAARRLIIFNSTRFLLVSVFNCFFFSALSSPSCPCLYLFLTVRPVVALPRSKSSPRILLLLLHTPQRRDKRVSFCSAGFCKVLSTLLFSTGGGESLDFSFEPEPLKSRSKIRDLELGCPYICLTSAAGRRFASWPFSPPPSLVLLLLLIIPFGAFASSFSFSCLTFPVVLFSSSPVPVFVRLSSLR